MTRFKILGILSRRKGWLSLRDICRSSLSENWRAPHFRANLHTQLTRLHDYGLVRRRRDRWGWFRWHGFGGYVYQISERGRARLRWASETGQLKSSDKR